MSKKILVVGGGGREHALVWKLSCESAGHQLFCAPGNAGTAERAVNVPVAADDLSGLRAWALKERPDLTVVGPEVPLCQGITDLFEAEGLRVFGPNQAAARLEGSKIFAKELMQAAGVPTARAACFEEACEALRYAGQLGAPVVVKADGLAAGKGVFVCKTLDEARDAIDLILQGGAFGESGRQVLVEECLEGEEASIMALVDGERFVVLAPSQDHKRALDGDQGPNTGGMGAYSPTGAVRAEDWPVIQRDVFGATLAELKRRGICYRGVLYAGIMLTSEGPRVLEFNCRFGDPETQVVLPRMTSDLLPVLEACVAGCLEPEQIAWRPDSAVCVVMAAEGYPGAYARGDEIAGLQAAGLSGEVLVFHAGTAEEEGQVVTAGGRVLGVTALGRCLDDAIHAAYRAVADIRFRGACYRRDIAARELARCQ